MEPWPLASITCSHGGFTSAPMFHTHTRKSSSCDISIFRQTWWGHEFLKCIWIIWRYLKIFEARKHVTIMFEFFRVICMWSYLWDQSKDSKCSMEVLHKVLKSIGLHLCGFVMFLGGFLWRTWSHSCCAQQFHVCKVNRGGAQELLRLQLVEDPDRFTLFIWEAWLKMIEDGWSSFWQSCCVVEDTRSPNNILSN